MSKELVWAMVGPVEIVALQRRQQYCHPGSCFDADMAETTDQADRFWRIEPSSTAPTTTFFVVVGGGFLGAGERSARSAVSAASASKHEPGCQSCCCSFCWGSPRKEPMTLPCT